MAILKLIPNDGTYDQMKPLRWISGCKVLRSYDLSSATDRFPLDFQFIVVENQFGREVARSWVDSGLEANIFQAPDGSKERLIHFTVGQPLGYLSSWPLFTLCHHIVVWLAAESVYPGRKFSKYALLGDDIVIGDKRVADAYFQLITMFGVSISLPKSLVSDSAFFEFAKRFRGPGKGLLFPSSSFLQMTGDSDADWAGDALDRKYITGKKLYCHWRQLYIVEEQEAAA